MQTQTEQMSDEDVEILALRLLRISPNLSEKFKPLLSEIRKTLEVTMSTGFSHGVLFRPLMIERRHRYFKNGICFEVVRKNKRADILAAGGRFVHLVRFEEITIDQGIDSII